MSLYKYLSIYLSQYPCLFLKDVCIYLSFYECLSIYVYHALKDFYINLYCFYLFTSNSNRCIYISIYLCLSIYFYFQKMPVSIYLSICVSMSISKRCLWSHLLSSLWVPSIEQENKFFLPS